MILLIKLIAAHLIGDFLLQSDRLCNNKYSDNISDRMTALLLHSSIQATLSYFFVGEWSCWLLPVIIGISHFLIDFIKIKSGRKGLIAFVSDQIAHYAVLILLWWLMFAKTGVGKIDSTESLLSISTWMIATSYIAVLAPTSILIKTFIDYENWMPVDQSVQGLPNAGKWIGFLERILILTFIFTENVEGIGFLLAAKSVFRFGELNKSKDIKVTEYVLIGTLSSFAVAILIGFAVKWFLS